MAPCARCGTFLCGACTEVMREAAWCESCVSWLRSHGEPSKAVKWLIGLGVVGLLSFPLCAFLAPVLNLAIAVAGLWVPTRELRRIRQGEGPLRGIRQAQVARVLAALNAVLVLAWLVIVFFALVTRRKLT